MPFPILKHFTQNENWGEADRMDHGLLYDLDALRDHIERPIVISCGTQKIHRVGSFHYDGLAADILVPGMNLFHLFLAALRFQFTGIGIYPYWKYKGEQCGGLHLDKRPIKPPYEYKALWMGVASKDKDGKEITSYTELSSFTIKKHIFKL